MLIGVSKMEMRVREERLPGIGMRYDLDLPDHRRLFVIAEPGGRRHLGLSRGGDEPEWQVTLDQDRAVMVAALLLGARFTLDTSHDDSVASDEVVVDTVELGPASPAIGKVLPEIALPDADAVVLAIVSDSTPELVEDDAAHRCLPGDRVVVAARGARIDELSRHLRGPLTSDVPA